GRAQRGAGLRKLECADDAAAVVRVQGRSSAWVSLGEQLVGALAAEPVVEPFQPLARAGLGRGRQLEIGERGSEVEAGPADDDRRASSGKDLVDRRVRQLLVLADRRLLLEPPDPDQ